MPLLLPAALDAMGSSSGSSIKDAKATPRCGVKLNGDRDLGLLGEDTGDKGGDAFGDGSAAPMGKIMSDRRANTLYLPLGW